MQLDLSTAVMPEGSQLQLDPSTAISPDQLSLDLSTAIAPRVPTYGEVAKAIIPGTQAQLQQSLGGGIRAAGDVVRGVTGYGGMSELGHGIAESGTRNLEATQPKNMTFGQETLYAGGVSTGISLAAGLAYPLMGFPGVLTAMGLAQGGQTYEQAREFGLAPGRALAHSVFEGAVEAGTELLPARALFGAHKNILSRFVSFLSKEVPGELVATALQDASAKLGYQPDMTVDQFLHDMLLTVTSVAVSAPLQVGAVHAAARVGAALTPGGAAGAPTPATPPAILQPNPQVVAPLGGAAPDAFDQLDMATVVKPDLSIETMKQQVAAHPPTPAEIELANAVEEAMKTVTKETRAKGEEPDIVNSEWIVNHMRTKYPDQNQATLTPPEQHPVLFGAEAGKTLGEVTVQPGQVVTSGYYDEKHTPIVMKLMHDTMQDWVSRYAPTAKVVLTTQDKFNEATIAQTQFKDGYAFVAVPHFYRTMQERMGDTSVYPEGIQEFFAQSKVVYALSHEFGRILTETSFRGAPTDVKNELVATWQSLRARVESGEMTASEFLQRWMSPWKLARGFRSQDATMQADRYIQTTMYGEDVGHDKDVSAVKATDFIRKLVDRTDGNTEQILSFQSFMAEQMARYAHQKDIAAKSPIGRFFKTTMERLREFFDHLLSSGQLQHTKAIEAEPAFTRWLDSMAAGQSAIATDVAKTKKKKATGKAKSRKAESPMAPVQPTAVDPTKETKRLRALAIQLKKDAPEDYALVMNMIKEQDFELAQQTLNNFFDADGTPKFEIGDTVNDDAARKGFDPVNRAGLTAEEAKNATVMAYVRQMAKDFGAIEKTPTFKTFAGDWELFNLWQQKQAAQSALTDIETSLRAPAYVEDGVITDASALQLPIRQNLLNMVDSANRNMRALLSKYENYRTAHTPPPSVARLFAAIEAGAKATIEANARPTVSVLLDANGIPKAALHGTGTGDPEHFGITEFDPNRRGTATWAEDARHAFFAAADPVTTKSYSELGSEMVKTFKTEQDKQQHDRLMNKAKMHDKERSLIRTQAALLARPHMLSSTTWSPSAPTGVRTEYARLLDLARQHNERTQRLMQEAAKHVTYVQAAETTYPLYLALLNPLEHDAKGGGYSSDLYLNLITQAKAEGKDGVIVYNIYDSGPMTTIYMWFDPQQAKSAYGNTGTFAKTNEIHFEIGDETEAAMENVLDAIPNDAGVNKAELGEAFKNLKRWQLAMLQLQQLAKLNPNVAGLSYFNRINLVYEQLRKTLMSKGIEIARNWLFLMKESRAFLDRALTAEYQSEQHWTTLEQGANGVWIHTPSETLKTRLQQMGVSTESDRGKMVAQTFVDTKNIHLMQLQSLERILYDRMVKRYKDPTVLAVKAKQLFDTVTAIREVPFLPQSRFGKYSIVISELQEKGPAKPVHIEYYESKRERDSAYTKLHSSVLARGNRRISVHNLSDAVSTMPSIPQTYIDTVVDILDLSQEDALAMQMAAQAVKGKAVFGKYDKEFRSITGASQDLQRNFTDAVWHTANLLAKLKYRPEFNRATTMVSRQIRELHVQNKYTGQLQDLQKWMEVQRDYILNPQSEFQKVRSAVTLLALWGNVKTAAVNMTSIVNTWATLVDKFGYKNATEEILRALKDEAHALTSTDQFSAADKQLREMLHIEGVTDQSYAYMLAEMSNAGALKRAFKQTKSGQAFEHLMQFGMLPFRIVEIYSRRAGALAAARLMIKDGASIEAAHDFARSEVLLTQGDYTPGNRPRFMQGKQNLAFIFMTFMQMMMFLMGGGVGAAAAARLWVFYGLLGGLMGLPMMENMMDVLKIVWRKILRQDEDPKQEMYRFLNEVTGGNGQWLMNGMFHNIGGIDLSRSISLGRVIPGTDVLAGEGDLKFKVENMAADLSGPFGGMVQGVLQFATSTDPNWVRRAAYALPGTSRSLMQTYLFSTEGVRGSGGHIITRDRDGTIRDLTGYELGARALGFQPAIVTQNREIERAQRETQQYWMGKRSSLLRLMWEAHVQNDREALADAKDEVRAFNDKVPAKELKLTERDMLQSTKARQRVLEREEHGQAPIARFDPLYREVERALLGELR